MELSNLIFFAKISESEGPRVIKVAHYRLLIYKHKYAKKDEKNYKHKKYLITRVI